MRAAAAALVLTACHAVPQLDGASLICDDDAACPQGLRCHRGGCIRNSPPSVDPVGVIFATVGQPITLRVSVEDPEGDVVTVTWEQTAGSTLITSPVTGLATTVTPASAETYTLLVTPRDPYAAGAGTPLSIIAMTTPPTGEASYVNDRFADTANCGGIDQPCGTIAAGLAARPRPDSPLLVAATEGGAYRHCLTLGGEESLWGGFSPSWQFDPDLAERTRIECDLASVPADPNWPAGVTAVGHTLRGNASVGNVVLTTDSSAVSGAPPWGLVGVLIPEAGSAPALSDVDVELPACNACVAVGVMSTGASPQLSGVNILSGPAVFEHPVVIAGMQIFGGAPRIEGRNGRGSVTLSTAAETLAYGILVSDSAALLDDMDVYGGMAPYLIGIEVVAGTTTIANSTVDLRAFGTFFMFGIVVSPADITDEEPVTIVGPPQATLTGNSVLLRGGSGGFSIAPCLGVGVLLAIDFTGAAPSPNEVRDSPAIEISGELGLSGGIVAIGGTATLVNNQVATHSSAVNDAGCAEEMASIFPYLTDSLGAVGILVAGADGDRVERNTIEIEANLHHVAGLHVQEAKAVTVLDNTIDVAKGGSAVATASACAAVLSSSAEVTLGEESILDGNRLRVHEQTASGTGLWLLGYKPWRITDNFIYGGDGLYAAGVVVQDQGATSGWPQVLHNTISGGGDGANSLVSRGVAFDSSSGSGAETPLPTGSAGVWVNNLIDGGDAGGRRFVVDNALSASFDEALGNIGMMESALPAPVPLAAVYDNWWFTRRLHWIAPATSTVMSMTTSYGNPPVLSNEYWTPTGGRPVAVWASQLGSATTGGIVVGLADRIGFAAVTNGYVEFQWANPLAPSGAVLTPTVVAYGEEDAKPPQDLVFASTVESPALWVMRGLSPARGGGFSQPVQLAAGTVTRIAVTRADADLGGGDRFYYVVDEIGADPTLGAWPTAPQTLPNLPATAVSALAAGPIVNSGVGAASYAIVAVNSGGVLTIFNTANPQEQFVPVPPACQTSAPTALHLAPMACGLLCAIRDTLLVGCANGTVEFYELAGGVLTPTRSTPAALAAPVEVIAAYGDLLAVAHRSSSRIAVYNVGAGIQGPTSHNLLADIGIRHPTSGMYLDVASLGASPQLSAGSCPLKMRYEAAPPEDYDLHLFAGSASDCRNGGATFAEIIAQTSVSDTTLIELDIDQGNRTPTLAPEVGADEE